MGISSLLPIDELFGPTLQGEGSMAGWRSMFLRLGGCDGVDGFGHLCTWCDSMRAADSHNKKLWTYLTPDAIVGQLVRLAPHCKTVTISGGNPALHDLTALVEQLQEADYAIAVETQGTKFHPWLLMTDVVTISPKPPSAGFHYPRTLLGKMMKGFYGNDDPYRPELTLKIVVDSNSEEDYTFARGIITEFQTYFDNTYLSVLTAPDDDALTLMGKWYELAEKMKNDPRIPDIGCLPQLHVALWGHGRGI